MSPAPEAAEIVASQATTSMRSILVLGAGELGMAVLQPLARRARKAGVAVSVLLRPVTLTSDDARKRAELDELRALGVAAVSGDVASASVKTLAELFARYDEVLSCVGFAAGRGTQAKLAEAALQAGIRRYSPWQFGVDYDVLGRCSAQDLFDEQLDVRDLLRGQNRVEWVIISPGMFTSFLFEPSFGVVDLARGVVHALGGWNNAVTVTTPEDIGRLTTEIIFAEPRIRNEIVHLAGDTITYGQIADIVERALGRPIERTAWTAPMLEQALKEAPGDGMRKYRAVFAAGPGMAWDKTATFNHRRGFAVTSAQQWLDENLAR